MNRRVVRPLLRVALAVALALPVRAEKGLGPAASLLDPDTHLSQAKSLLDSGDRVEGGHHLQVALEVASVGTPTWSSAYQLAMEKRPDLFAQTLIGANFTVPLALVPEDESLYAPDEIFEVPPYGPQLAFLDNDRRDTIRFHLKNNQPLDAAHVIENFLDIQRNHLPGLMLAAILYEKYGQLALAEARWTEVATKARDVDSHARFVALFGIFRTKYRRQDFQTAETLLAKYIKEAQAHLADALEKFKTADGGKDTLYWAVLEGRRHLVEGLNTLGVLKFFRKNHEEALLYFEQASLLVPGSIVLTLNHVQSLEKLLHTGTGRQIHSTLAEALSGLERALLAQLDRQIDEGTLNLSAPLTFRELLRELVARVRVRQAIFERSIGEMKAAHGLLTDALNLTDRSALAQYFMGLELKGADRLDEALVRFKRAMELALPRKLGAEARKRVDEVFELQALRAHWARTRNDQLKEHFEEKISPGQLQILRRDLADGVGMLERGEFPKAREHFLRLSQYHKDSVDLFRWLGFANQEMGRFKEALVAYDRALAIDPVDPWSLSQKAIALYEYSNDLPNALCLAGEAAKIKGDDPSILSNLGWLHAMAGELRKGIELLLAAIEKSPKDPRHHFRLGMTYYNLGVYPFAAAKFQDVLTLHSKHPKANIFLGLAFARVGKMGEAISQLSKSLELLRDNPDLTLLVTNDLALLKGSSAPAMAPGPKGSADPRLLLTREEIVRVSAAHAVLTQARTLVLKGELASAKELLTSAHKEFPTAIELSLAYAFVLLTAKPTAPKLAKEVTSGILDLNTQDIRAHHLLAHIQFQEGGVGEFIDGILKFQRLPQGLVLSEFLEAIAKRWVEVLDIDKNDESAIDAYGKIELLQGRLDSAREVLSRSKSVEGKQLLGETQVRQFFLDHKQLTFQQAKQALTEAGYAQVDKLDIVWKQVMEPSTPVQERVVAKPPSIQPAKEMEGWWRLDPSIKSYVNDNTGRVGRIDLNNTLVFNRRWSQIDQSRRRKVEKEEAIRTREALERDFEIKEVKEKKEQERIRSNIGGPERSKTVSPPAWGLPQPAGALIVSETTEPPLKNQLKAIAAKHMATGLELVSGGRLPDAIHEFKAAVNLDPRSEEPLVTLALALAINGERVKAQTLLSSGRHPLSSPIVSLLRGHLAWEEGRVDDAERAFVQAVSLQVALPPPPKKKKKGRGKNKTDLSTSELAYLTVSRKAWQETLVDNPADLDGNLNVALLDFLTGRALAALSRLEGLKGTPEGAKGFAEVSFFLSKTQPGSLHLRKAVETLSSVEGAPGFLELQKALAQKLARSR